MARVHYPSDRIPTKGLIIAGASQPLSPDKDPKEAPKNKGDPSASKGLKKVAKKSKGELSDNKDREGEPHQLIILPWEAIVKEELPMKRAKIDAPLACSSALIREYKASSSSLPKLGLDSLAPIVQARIQETILASNYNDEEPLEVLQRATANKGKAPIDPIPKESNETTPQATLPLRH